MNNIDIDLQVPVAHSSGQPFPLSSNAHLPSGIVSGYVIVAPRHAHMPGEESEGEKDPLRLNGIYSNDLRHPHSSPHDDNNDDPNPYPLQSPSMLLTNKYDLNDCPSDKLICSKFLAGNPENDCTGTDLVKGSQWRCVSRSPLPFAESLGDSEKGEWEDVTDLVNGIVDAVDLAELEIAEAGEQGLKLNNPNCIITAYGVNGVGNCENPIVQSQANCESGLDAAWIHSESSPAALERSQGTGSILSPGRHPGPNTCCQHEGEVNPATSSLAEASTNLNLRLPTTGLPENQQTHNNRNVSVISRNRAANDTSQFVEPAPYIPRDFSSLNRADVQEIHRYQEMLDPFQRRLLRMVENKVELHPERYGHNDYLETATFLILSNWPSAEKLAFCSIPSKMNRSGRCCLHQFCPYCCWKVRKTAQLRYAPSFYEGNWHWVNGSFKGDLEFTGTDGYAWLDYWNAYNYGFEQLLKEGLIAGAYWTEELAVNSFLPTRVLPHVHAVIDALDLTDTMKETLAEHVSDYLRKDVGAVFLKPDIKTTPILDDKSLFDRIGYMNKPMKLLKPYQRAWASASLHNRFRAQPLNSELTDLIKGHSEITRRRPKMNYKGTLDPRNKRYIGIKTKEHKKREHQELINDLKSQPAEFIQNCEEGDFFVTTV